MMWFYLLPAWGVVNLIAYLGAPVLALFCVDQSGWCDNHTAIRVEPRLPMWLSWFQTPDNSLLGDAAWASMEPEHWAWRKRFSGRVQSYLGRLGWLWRNAAYGFERTVLRADLAQYSIAEVHARGDPWIKDKDNAVVGYCFTSIGKYWNLVWIKRLWGRRCFYCNLGWNLKTYAERPERLLTEPTAQYVVSPRFSTLN